MKTKNDGIFEKTIQSILPVFVVLLGIVLCIIIWVIFKAFMYIGIIIIIVFGFYLIKNTINKLKTWWEGE